VRVTLHEYSMTKKIVKIVNNAAEAQNAVRVNVVNLVAGESSCIIPDCVQMYYDLIAKGTKAEGAVVKTRVVKTEMRCPNCGKNFPRPRFSFACPDCGALGNPTGIGEEFYVESIEIET